MDLLAVVIGLGVLYVITRWVLSFDAPERGYGDDSDDDTGGSDRNQPLGPWWPSGVSPDPQPDKELV